jgi:hypothetical protein
MSGSFPTVQPLQTVMSAIARVNYPGQKYAAHLCAATSAWTIPKVVVLEHHMTCRFDAVSLPERRKVLSGLGQSIE